MSGAIPSEPDDADADAVTDSRARAKKAPNAFRTISEVADELHIPQHVLRFWETKFPQVKPLKRGGGRRYYRPDDIALLRRISGLLYVQGYTIKGVQRLLREGGGRLSDDIPPPAPEDMTPDEGMEGEPQDLLALDDPQLPMPGLMPRPASPASSRAAKSRGEPQGAPSSDPAAAELEVIRLRGLLRETLRELEALRAMLA